MIELSLYKSPYSIDQFWFVQPMLVGSFERWIFHHQSDELVTHTRMWIALCHV